MRRMHTFAARLVRAVALSAALGLASTTTSARPLSAQETAYPAAEQGAAPSAGATTEAVSAPAQGSSGLPQRAAPPRTLRDYTHVFVAFALAWLLLFGYALSLGRKFARIEREMETLRGGRGA